MFCSDPCGGPCELRKFGVSLAPFVSVPFRTLAGRSVSLNGSSPPSPSWSPSLPSPPFPQVRRLLDELRANRADDAKPALLVLHERRVMFGPAKSHQNKALIADWRSRGELHVTPAGSNDDWYWLYAAVVEKSSILITNDELRDHIFQMLPAPKLFYRWQARHQARFRSPAEPLSFETWVGVGRRWVGGCVQGSREDGASRALSPLSQTVARLKNVRPPLWCSRPCCRCASGSL